MSDHRLRDKVEAHDPTNRVAGLEAKGSQRMINAVYYQTNMLPCHYLDWIVGTSIGGFIAPMHFSLQQWPQHHQSLFNCSSNDFVLKLYTSRCSFSNHAQTGQKLTQHSSQDLNINITSVTAASLSTSKFLGCNLEFSSLSDPVSTKALLNPYLATN